MDLQVLEHTEGNHKIEFIGDYEGGLRILTYHTKNGDNIETDFSLSKKDVKLLIAFIEARLD